MNDEAPIDFCKIDSDLDANPKIQAAGCFGRDVFEFVLRANRRMRRDGSIPLRYIELGYLARQLMFDGVAAQFGADPIEIARRALAAAVDALLLEIDPIVGEVRIVGWEEEWGTRQPKPGRERTRAWRDRKVIASPVTTDRHGDAIEIRSEGEEKRGEDQTLSPDSDIGPELPDPPAIASADREDAWKQLRGVPNVSAADIERKAQEIAGSRDRRIKLNHDTWAYAAGVHAILRREGQLDGSVAWPAMPVGDAMNELVKRTAEVLAMTPIPDYVRATDLIRRRIDVAAAEAKREGHLRWFTPMRMFDSKSFWRAVEMTPEQASARAGPQRSPPTPTEPPRRMKNLS